MDKETIALVEDVRKSLVEFGKQQTGSALKKTRKITSQIIWAPQQYLDQLDDILRTSKSKEEAIPRIRSVVRSSEEAALKSMTLLPDDTGHHIVQSRTGGDALTELPYQRTGPIIKGLSDKHKMTFGNTTGSGGNLPAEMSLSNYAHKADDRATGLERESGIGKNPDKATTAHPRGTAGAANLKGVDLSSDKAIAADLDTKVTQQITDARTAAATDLPRQQAIRDLVPGAYQGDVADIATARQSALTLDPADVRRSYLKLTGGKAMFSQGFGGMLGFLSNQKALDAAAKGDVKTAITEGATDFVKGEAISQVAQRTVIPAVQKVLPSFIGGLARFTPLMTSLSVGATIGQVMKDNLDVNTSTSGRGAGRKALSGTQ